MKKLILFYLSWCLLPVLIVGVVIFYAVNWIFKPAENVFEIGCAEFFFPLLKMMVFKDV